MIVVSWSKLPMSEAMTGTFKAVSPGPEPVVPRLAVEMGIIRGRHAVFRLAHEADFADWDRVAVHFELINGKILAEPIEASSREVVKNGTRLKLKLPRKKVLSGIRLVPATPSVARIDLPPPAECGLSELYPRDDGKEMPEALSRANTVRDVETLGFILTQIMEGKHHTDYAKTEVVKKFAYKCMQNGTKDDTLRAIVLIDSMWHMVDRFDERYGKKNPVHLKISFLFIRMLCHVMVGDFESSLKDMEELFESRSLVTEVPLIGTNLCSALVLFAWTLGMGNQVGRSIIVFDETITAFREAAYHMPARRQRPFSELSTPLRCASQAVGCVTALRKGKWDGDPGALYMTSQYSRLEGPAAHKRLAAQLEALALHIKDHGAQRQWSAGLI